MDDKLINALAKTPVEFLKILSEFCEEKNNDFRKYSKVYYELKEEPNKTPEQVIRLEELSLAFKVRANDAFIIQMAIDYFLLRLEKEHPKNIT